IRINAEDPLRDFAPAPGLVSVFRPPLGPGVRLDTFVRDGSTVPPFYDSLLAKLVVWDEDRPAAIARALRALGELSVQGVPTARRRSPCSSPPATASSCPSSRRRSRNASARRSRRCSGSRSPGSTSRSRSSSSGDSQPPRLPPDRLLPALPVGRDRPAPRLP